MGIHALQFKPCQHILVVVYQRKHGRTQVRQIEKIFNIVIILHLNFFKE